MIKVHRKGENSLESRLQSQVNWRDENAAKKSINLHKRIKNQFEGIIS